MSGNVRGYNLLLLFVPSFMSIWFVAKICVVFVLLVVFMLDIVYITKLQRVLYRSFSLSVVDVWATRYRARYFTQQASLRWSWSLIYLIRSNFFLLQFETRSVLTLILQILSGYLERADALEKHLLLLSVKLLIYVFCVLTHLTRIVSNVMTHGLEVRRG